MLSAGERPQPPHSSAIVDSPSVSVGKGHIMPDFDAKPGSSSNPANLIQEKRPKPAHVQHIWIVTGPAGCGKSTVGNGLRIELGVPFLEGDDVRYLVHWSFTSYSRETELIFGLI